MGACRKLISLTTGSPASIRARHTMLTLYEDASQLLKDPTVHWAKHWRMSYHEVAFGPRCDESGPQRTLPKMDEVLKKLDLNELYCDVMDSNKVFLGLHGCSLNSLPALSPKPSPDCGNQKTYHSSPNHQQNGLHVANNLSAALHYARLNGLHFSSDKDPIFFDGSLILACFSDPLGEGERYTHQPLITWNAKKRRNEKSGEELIVPPERFPSLINLGLFALKGPQRLFPLRQDQTMPFKEDKGVTC